jgi:hypothetical protein
VDSETEKAARNHAPPGSFGGSNLLVTKAIREATDYLTNFRSHAFRLLTDSQPDAILDGH